MSLYGKKNQSVFLDPRDQNQYEVIQLNGLNWFRENLRYRSSNDTIVEIENCHVFYPVSEAKNACPDGWRLPTEKEVKALVKQDRKRKINLVDTLSIELCGRIDYEKHAKPGLQNTFWLNEDVEHGHVAHWHTFAEKHEIHTHDVVQARRQFPVRCVCEIE